MLTNFNSLQPEVKRALARAELKRRGLSTSRDDPVLLAAFVALREGVGKLPTFPAPGVPESWRNQMAATGWPIAASFDQQVVALAARIGRDCLTTADKQLLDSLDSRPNSPMNGRDLVDLFAGIFNEF